MTLKDSGLSVSDLRLLKCDILLDNPDADLIPIQRLRKKTNLSIKTFIGEEAITALKAYFEKRRKGSRFVEPETITRESPLFRTWKKGKAKPMSRENMCTLVRNAFIESGTKKVSAHSLRRFLQTQMEEANVNVNWIDQMLGHELVNCRGAYSKPTDEQLEKAYRKGYDHIRIYSKVQPAPEEPEKPQTQAADTGLDVQEARTLEEVKSLLAKGYKYQMEMNGIQLFTK
jgi:integrase